MLLFQDFFSFSAQVLGHTALKNEEVNQTTSDRQQRKVCWVVVQSSQRGRGPERVAIGVSKSRVFYEIVGGLF